MLDPPPVAGALAAAEAGGGYAHLAWGEPECSFTLAHWRSQLDLRPALIDVWRALGREGGEVGGDALVRLLRGRGAYPRGGALSGRLLGILCELGLADLDREARCARSQTGPRTDLARSPAGRAYAARLAEAERHLGAGARLEASGRAPWHERPWMRSGKDLELDRDSIVRKDFKRAVRGYDEWEVQAHLREVNRSLARMLDQLAKADAELPEALAYRIAPRS